jgi:succinyl-CoA synthetase beta subunit
VLASPRYACNPLEHTAQTAIDINAGPTPEQLSSIAAFLGFEGASAVEAAQAVGNLYRMFISTDATMVEVNPMCETPEGKVFVADAKVNFDDNAAFRQPDIFALRDTAQEDPREVEAAKHDLNYIGLEGTIGCMVNGAGLAMATMDIIKLHGGAPANFLDVGGGANEQQVEKAFEILNSKPQRDLRRMSDFVQQTCADDKQVKTILVNIFGGIMRCDVIAQGILNAAQNIGLRKPIVIRLQGTNVDAAKELIASSGYRMVCFFVVLILHSCQQFVSCR